MSKHLLCEGFLDEGADLALPVAVFEPDVAFVRQGTKVWFAKGAPSQLHESLDESVELVESMDQLELAEVALPGGRTAKLPKDGLWTVEGVYQRSDVKNANKRYYPRSIWERLLGDPKSPVQTTIRERGMLGHLEHPKDGRTDGREGAILNVHAELKEDGTVWGRSELLNTPNGLILQEYTARNVRWGVSSRGAGSVDGTSGKVGDDYMVETWDAVMRPSTPGAFPTRMKGGKGVREEDEAAEQAAAAASAEPLAGAALVTECRVLFESSLDSLTPAERHLFFGKLVSKQQDLVRLTQSAAVTPSEAERVQAWLTRKLHECYESEQPQSVDALIDEALASGMDEDGESPGDLAAVIATLRAQIGEVEADSDDLRRRLRVAESDVLTLSEERDLVQEQLSEAQGTLAAVNRKLDLAEGLLAERPDCGPVQDAVLEVVQRLPEFACLRGFMEQLETPEQVEAFADTTIRLCMQVRVSESIEDSDAVLVDASSTHSFLPRGLLVESATKLPKGMRPSDVVIPGRGPQLAAAILGRRGSNHTTP